MLPSTSGCCNGVLCELWFYWYLRGGSYTQTYWHMHNAQSKHWFCLIYRVDGLDVLLYAARDIQAYRDHLNKLYPKIKFHVAHGKEGYMVKPVDNVETQNRLESLFQNTPCLCGTQSCHDPKVLKSVFKGVGHRLTLNSSKTEYFEDAVEVCCK